MRTFPDDKYQEIVVHDLLSGAERSLTFNKKNCDEVCWASYNQIIFSSNKSGNTNLWMVPGEGGPQVQITKGSGPDLGVKISTDLKKLLYHETQEVNDTSQNSARDLLGSIHGLDRATSGRIADYPGIWTPFMILSIL